MGGHGVCVCVCVSCAFHLNRLGNHVLQSLNRHLVLVITPVSAADLLMAVAHSHHAFVFTLYISDISALPHPLPPQVPDPQPSYTHTLSLAGLVFAPSLPRAFRTPQE